MVLTFGNGLLDGSKTLGGYLKQLLQATSSCSPQAKINMLISQLFSVITRNYEK
ncbi:MAG: hypothetical protein V4772_12505 [Pseudomonadota bacterium]